MKAKYDSINSWEGSQVWNLENGWIAHVEHSTHYGESIKCLEKDGKVWLANNGTKENGLGAEFYNKAFNTDKYVDLPDFAKDWKDKYNLIRTNFKREY